MSCYYRCLISLLFLLNIITCYCSILLLIVVLGIRKYSGLTYILILFIILLIVLFQIAKIFIGFFRVLLNIAYII